MHVDEEQLQRLVDAELAEPADEWAREHVVQCESCRDRVGRAKKAQNEVLALLRGLDHPRARVDHATVIARARAKSSRWITKAAGFVVAAALAGVAYAAPGSPLPALVARIFGGDGDASNVPAVQKAISETPGVSGVTVAAGARLVIAFTSTQPAGEIRVTLSDGAQVELRATGTGAAFTAGEDLLTIDNDSSHADFTIAIPRHAQWVEIRIGEDRVFLKDGARIVTERAAAGVDSYAIPLTPGG